MKKISISSLLVLSILAASCSFAFNTVTLEDSNTGMTVTLYPPSERDPGMLFYGNDRFGYSMYFPDFFTEVVLIPENGDGLILEAMNGYYRFRVSGGFMMFEDQLQTSMEAAKRYIEENADEATIFEKTGDDWWELSWWNGPERGIRKFITNGEIWSECEFINQPGRVRYEPDDYFELFERSLRTLSFPVG